MYIFSSVLLVVLAVFGAVSLVRELTAWAFSRKSDCSVIIVTPKSNCENAEFALRSALSHLNWSGKCGEIMVLFNCELDEQTAEICASICREYGFKGLISKREVIDKLI